MPESCAHDLKNPVRKGRAHYLCPKCGEDISMLLVLIFEMEQEAKEDKKNALLRKRRA